MKTEKQLIGPFRVSSEAFYNYSKTARGITPKVLELLWLAVRDGFLVDTTSFRKYPHTTNLWRNFCVNTGSPFISFVPRLTLASVEFDLCHTNLILFPECEHWLEDVLLKFRKPGSDYEIGNQEYGRAHSVPIRDIPKLAEILVCIASGAAITIK